MTEVVLPVSLSMIERPFSSSVMISKGEPGIGSSSDTKCALQYPCLSAAQKQTQGWTAMVKKEALQVGGTARESQ